MTKHLPPNRSDCIGYQHDHTQTHNLDGDDPPAAFNVMYSLGLTVLLGWNQTYKDSGPD